MKIVIAPDSFKGSLTSKEAGKAIAEGIERVDSSICTVIIPMADGGEGTVDSLVYATRGEILDAWVKDPLGRSLKAYYGVLGDGKTCVIETASASGLPLLTREERNPLLTTSYGTGELIRSALDRGYREFIIGLGGSATNDAGIGILQALGVKFLDTEGNELPCGGGDLRNLHDLNLDDFDPRIAESHFVIASDVNNPLVGPMGASAVFGPQKGADTSEIVAWLEGKLYRFADTVQHKLGISIHHSPGAGAAGGIGGMMQAFFPSRMEKGVEVVIKAANLHDALNGADLAVTGEGQMDQQTIHGKTPFGVAKAALEHGVPTVALVGTVGKGIEKLRECGIASVLSIVNKPMGLEEAMSNCYELLSNASEQMLRIYLLNTERVAGK